jgi:A/G-specific adenine glycosylase
VKLPALRQKLLDWYDENARDLPFRRTRDPYAIWVAEVMLQQTRVETVLPYYAKFLARFPDVKSLADAELEEVLAHWSGLGYYRRARFLHAGAKHVAELHDAVIPADPEAIRAIPGVGAYTTGAIASQAFDLPEALVDGNVARVMARLFLIESDTKKGKGLAEAWSHARELVRGPRPGALNNALMELGATVCVPREPRCLLCPVRAACRARIEGRERELPIASAKPERPRLVEVAAILPRDGGLVLARRVASGLFGGLWEPPRVSAKDVHAARASLEALVGSTVSLDPKPLRTVEHVLTHRVLDVSVHEGTLARAPKTVGAAHRDAYDAIEVVDLEDLEKRGISTLAKKILGSRKARARV